MKKYIGIVLLMMAGFDSFAQIQRTVVKQKNDSTVTEQVNTKGDGAKKQMLRELDLTRDQRAKMKEINQSMKASKGAIENDPALSEKQKKQKLKAFRQEQVAKIQAILTEEQKINFREQRAKNG